MPEQEAKAKFILENPWVIPAKQYSEMVGGALGNVTSAFSLKNLIMGKNKMPSGFGEQDGNIYHKKTGEIFTPKR